MKNMPRILPLIGVAMVGVLALNALAGAQSIPDMVSGAKAWAEETTKAGRNADKAAAKAEEKTAASAVDAAKDAAAKAAASPVRSAAVCAPTAAELAKAAGLSPAELQVLQSLGARRGQLDKREQDMDTQLALMAAAEAKVDAKLKQLTSLKAEVQGLMNQADAKEQAEIDRMVKVFETMKPKDAAPRLVLLDDSVRLPIASKMKERSLSAVLAAMPPTEAKKLTEALSNRFANIRKAADAGQAAQATPGKQAAAPAAPAPKAG